MAAAQFITIERHLRSVHVDRSASQVALTRRTAQSITIERHLRSVGRAGVSSPLTRRSSRPLTRRSKKPFGCSSVGNRLARATEALLRTRVKRSNREATKPHALSRGSSIPDDPPPPLTHLFALRASVGPCWSVVSLSGRVVSADCAVWWAWGSFGFRALFRCVRRLSRSGFVTPHYINFNNEQPRARASLDTRARGLYEKTSRGARRPRPRLNTGASAREPAAPDAKNMPKMPESRRRTNILLTSSASFHTAHAALVPLTHDSHRHTAPA